MTNIQLNPIGALRRFQKALCLADALDALHVSADEAEGMTQPQRNLIARIAQRGEPRTSWAEAVKMLRDREEIREFVKRGALAA